jgi:PAS domain S-box-containing protein
MNREDRCLLHSSPRWRSALGVRRLHNTPNLLSSLETNTDANGPQWADVGSKSLLGPVPDAICDVTDRRRMEGLKILDAVLRETRESEERFSLMADAAPALIWMSGTDMWRTYFNRPWLEFTGRSFDSELGNGWLEGVHPQDLANREDACRQASDRCAEFRIEYRLRRYDGEYRWILDTGVPRFNHDGSFAGFVGIGIDVTDRKHAEEALASVSHKLIEAQERERTRIAGELHDDIGQRLAFLAIELEQLQLSASNLSEVRRRISELHKQTSQIATDVQLVSHELHSSRLDYLGLAPAMRGFCQELGEQQRVEIDFTTYDLPNPLPPDISLCLFRVLQEALHNSAKHSGAQRFKVRLWGASDEVHLTVSDPGAGFTMESARESRGLGLISMEERVKFVKGTFSIHSQPKRGTRIHACIPLAERIDFLRAAS